MDRIGSYSPIKVAVYNESGELELRQNDGTGDLIRLITVNKLTCLDADTKEAKAVLAYLQELDNDSEVVVYKFTNGTK